METLQPFFDAIAGNELGVLGFVGIILKFAVDLYARGISKVLPQRFRWESWPKWGKMLFAGVTGLLGGGLLAFAGGATWLMALKAGLGVAVSAMGLDAIGKTLKKKDPS